MTPERKRLGELLVHWGLIEQTALDAALELQRRETPRRRLGVLLIEQGFLSGTKLTQLLSHQFGLPFVSLARVQYTPDLVETVPGALAHRLRVVPICTSGDDVLFVATDDPTLPNLEESVRTACNREVRLMVAAPNEVQSVLDQYYAGIQTVMPPPPPRSMPGVKPTGAVMSAVSGPTEAAVERESDIVELSSDDFEYDQEEQEPSVLAVGTVGKFFEKCEDAAKRQGMSLSRATLVTAGSVARRVQPIALVVKEDTFATDRVGLTTLSMELGAHLVIWSDELGEDYLEPLLATARRTSRRNAASD